MALGDYKLIKDNGTNFDEKTVSAVENKVLTFDSSGNPVMLSIGAIPKRIVSTTDDATAVIDVTVTDIYQLYSMSNTTAISITGTPVDGHGLILRLKSNSGSVTISWSADFAALGFALPTSITTKWWIGGFMYNSIAGKYQALSYNLEA